MESRSVQRSHLRRTRRARGALRSVEVVGRGLERTPLGLSPKRSQTCGRRAFAASRRGAGRARLDATGAIRHVTTIGRVDGKEGIGRGWIRTNEYRNCNSDPLPLGYSANQMIGRLNSSLRRPATKRGSYAMHKWFSMDFVRPIVTSSRACRKMVTGICPPVASHPFELYVFNSARRLVEPGENACNATDGKALISRRGVAEPDGDADLVDVAQPAAPIRGRGWTFSTLARHLAGRSAPDGRMGPAAAPPAGGDDLSHARVAVGAGSAVRTPPDASACSRSTTATNSLAYCRFN